MTVKDLKDSLEPRSQDDNVLIFRPVNSYGFHEIDRAVTEQAFNEMTREIDMALAGDEMSALAKFAYLMFLKHAESGMYPNSYQAKGVRS